MAVVSKIMNVSLFFFLPTFSGSDDIMISSVKEEICFFKAKSSILDFLKCIHTREDIISGTYN